MKHKSNVPSPWKTKSIRSVYENPWIEIEHHEVINPSGLDGIYGKVKFKNYAIGILPVDDQGFTWLVGQYRYTLNEYSWEIPMGGGDLNTDPIISAKKELREETGIKAREWQLLMTLHTSNSVTDEKGFIYVAKDLSFGRKQLEATEDITVKKVSLDEALTMVENNIITDSISINAILMYFYRNKR